MGYPIRLFNPADVGVTFLGQIYITNKDYITSDPNMIKAFVAATTKGLAWALDPANKKEVTDIVMKYAGAKADRGAPGIYLDDGSAVRDRAEHEGCRSGLCIGRRMEHDAEIHGGLWFD